MFILLQSYTGLSKFICLYFCYFPSLDDLDFPLNSSNLWNSIRNAVNRDAVPSFSINAHENKPYLASYSVLVKAFIIYIDCGLFFFSPPGFRWWDYCDWMRPARSVCHSIVECTAFSQKICNAWSVSQHVRYMRLVFVAFLALELLSVAFWLLLRSFFVCIHTSKPE